MRTDHDCIDKERDIVISSGTVASEALRTKLNYPALNLVRTDTKTVLVSVRKQPCTFMYKTASGMIRFGHDGTDGFASGTDRDH